MASGVTKAIRLSRDELQAIEEFLEENSFFDFSSLARTAILAFIKEPSVSIKPVTRVPLRKKNGKESLRS